MGNDKVHNGQQGHVADNSAAQAGFSKEQLAKFAELEAKFAEHVNSLKEEASLNPKNLDGKIERGQPGYFAFNNKAPGKGGGASLA